MKRRSFFSACVAAVGALFGIKPRKARASCDCDGDGAEPDYALVSSELIEGTYTVSNDIVFSSGGKEMLRLTPEGMSYNGQIVKDAGKAHRLFLEWLASGVLSDATPNE